MWRNIAITVTEIGLQFIFTEGVRGVYKNEPGVLSSIHFVSEEDMVFLSLLTKNKHETLIQWMLDRVVLTFSIEDVLCTLSNAARCV